MPLISTRGAASAQGFGEFAQSGPRNYIEDVFSTYLYTGNGSTQTITNGIDLSTKGGLVWTKIRSAADRNALIDSARGINKLLNSDGTFAQATQNNMITALTTTGYTLGTDGTGQTNLNTATYASWTFRKQEKFFDIVTFTAPAVGVTTTVSHSLGSTPGCIIMKSTTNTANWVVLHRYDQTMFGELNTTAAFQSAGFNANFTATSFDVKGGFNITANSGTYVAYLFAHNAGGFGLSGTDNVISCGSYTGNGSATGPTVTLGYEPQWLLIKRTDTSGLGWYMQDVMRGFSQTQTTLLEANSSAAEVTINVVTPTATGFQLVNTQTGYNENGGTYIYIAIRRGPMKVPTSGTSVFKPFTYNNSAGGFTQTQNAGFPTDFALESDRINPANHYLVSRLQGPRAQMASNSTLDEASYNTGGDQQKFDLQNLFAQQNSIDTSVLLYCFRRAPGFFDVVCYTGTGAGQVVSHNLGVVPQLMIFKCRSTSGTNWIVTNAFTGYMSLNLTTARDSTTPWDFNGTAPTSTQLTTRAISNLNINSSGSTYVAYLFATVAGVSKVGSYTGSGTTKQIDCGFTAGARFVLIKRTDSTGDWYVYDSARGIVAGNDPYLFLNSTAAEVTSTDYVDTYSAGFELSSTAPAGLNANGGTYIFLAIA